MAVKKRKKPVGKWRDEFYVTIYQVLREGGSESDVCKALEISHRQWITWKQQRPSIQKILELPECRVDSRSPNGHEQETVHDYVYRRLSPELQKLWDDIHKWKHEKNGIRKIEMVLANKGKAIRQSLFLHALTISNFNPTRACRRVCLSFKTLNEWIDKDPDFQRLFKQMEIVRKDLYEECLILKCKGFWTKDEKGKTVWMPGDTKAIIFANSTKNRDRGYGRNLELTHHAPDQASIAIQEVLHEVPLEIRERMLEKLREQKRLAHQQDEPIDAEFEVKTEQ